MPLDMFVMTTFMACMTTTMEWLMITTNLSCLYDYGIIYVTNDYNYNYTCFQGFGIMLGLDPQVELTNISNYANQKEMVIISFETKIVHGWTMGWHE